jgi:N-acetyl sugar amidotransferase
MKYCRCCVLPDTRSGIEIEEDGICSACKAHKTKVTAIDWEKRQQQLNRIVDYAKSHSKGYDCVIPVSGGKDSTWQVVKCLEYRLNPLAVTWKTPARTKIGAKNLANLISLGVDHIDYQINPKVEKKFMYKAFAKFGSTAIPMHMALFNIPLKIAVSFDIPLIVWGENSAVEYSGTDKDLEGYRLDQNWLLKFGVTNETTASDWISDDLSKRELTPYFGPPLALVEEKNILAFFLGYFLNWDPVETFRVAQENGFRIRQEGPKTGYYDFADIDCDFISIHHYLKWYKFGFTRLFDNLSLEIRNGRLTRPEAINIIKEKGDRKPVEDIQKFCRFLDISCEHFDEICEKFRNTNIWKKKNDKWVIEDFLISDWVW